MFLCRFRIDYGYKWNYLVSGDNELCTVLSFTCQQVNCSSPVNPVTCSGPTIISLPVTGDPHHVMSHDFSGKRIKQDSTRAWLTCDKLESDQPKAIPAENLEEFRGCSQQLLSLLINCNWKNGMVVFNLLVLSTTDLYYQRHNKKQQTSCLRSWNQRMFCLKNDWWSIIKIVKNQFCVDWPIYCWLISCNVTNVRIWYISWGFWIVK